jgi:hypothetical protein
MAKERTPAPVMHDEDQPTNLSNNTHLNDLILQLPLSRRQALRGGLSVATAALFGSLGLAACDDSDDDGPAGLSLGFTAVPKHTNDVVTVPAGYTARVLLSWGQPMITGQSAPDRIYNLTSAQQANAIGDHHDGMYYFGLGSGTGVPGNPDPNSSNRGLLAMNHEAITEDFAHIKGPSFSPLDTDEGRNQDFLLPRAKAFNTAEDPGKYDIDSARTSTEECLKEMALHGVSISELAKDGAGQFQFVQTSPYNRRVTVNTEMDITGPVTAKPELILTKFSAQTGKGTKVRGTLNNCANGFTPWGTYLTCEENWAGYFGHSGIKFDSNDLTEGRISAPADLARYGIGRHGFQNLRWYSAPDTVDNLISRFQINPTGESAADDFRNEVNTFGYVVEIDPYDPTSTPKKRTALGRLAHEGVWPRFVVGKKIAFYMGDDNRNDYFYKFVSDATFTGTEARVNNILDSGTLFAAKFNGDGTGTWLPLTVAALNDSVNFPTQADICVKTRQAADAAGATKMDRPEWATINPLNGEVYLTLTNNSNRRPVGTTTSGSQLVTDAANPRAYTDPRTAVPPFISATTANGNNNGHIIRLREAGDDPAATSFTWDIYLFGAQADADATNVNVSKLSAENDFSSPDGLWFSRATNPANGLLWIQTDDGQYVDTTNCMLLAAIPGQVGDGAAATITNTVGSVTGTQATRLGKAATADLVRRFLVGPKGCEITGIDSTPDGKTLFVNIQHPGEAGGFSNYDQTTNTFSQQSAFNVLPGDDRARSATLVITKNDGGVVGI